MTKTKNFLAISLLSSLVFAAERGPSKTSTNHKTKDYRSKIGMNIGGVTDFDSYVVFADALRNGIWIEDWSQRKEKPTDLLNDGNVAQTIPRDGRKPFAYVPVMAKPSDVFQLKMTGKITIAIQDAEKKSYSNQSGSNTVDIRFKKETFKTSVTIRAAEKGASVELYYPGQSGNLFHSLLVEQCKPFDILRGLNWNRTNNSPVVSASDVVNSNSMSQGSSVWGCSDFLFMELCEQADADCYITIPHLADKSYLTQLAQWCSQWKEKTGRDIYLEYSNELWNRQFEQSKWAREEGQKKYPRKFGEQDNQWGLRALASYSGYRAGLALKTIDETFADYHSVIAWQAASNYTGTLMYDEFVKTYGSHPECWAIAPYMHLHLDHWVRDVQDVVCGPNANRNGKKARKSKDLTDAQRAKVAKILDETFTKEKILDLLLNSQDDGIARSKKWMQNQAAFAKERGMRMISYESGQHILPPTPHAVAYPDWAARMIELQRMPAMRTAYQEFHKAWREAGGAEHVFLSLIQQPRTKTGAAFGHQEFMGDTESVKWQALMEIIQQNQN